MMMTSTKLIAAITLCVVSLPSISFAADVASAPVAKTAVKKAGQATTQAPTKEIGKIATPVAGTVIGNQGDNQYPSGTPVIPPKPKKELLEGAAIKANVAKP
jgi:hypothetical protein